MVALLLLCRFSDAGNDEALDALGRPASEKRQGTKSREVGAPSVPRALWGFSGGVRLGEVGQSARPNWLPGRMGVGDGPDERSGRCRTALTVSLRADLSTCVSGGYAGRASQNGERHWARGSVMRAL